MNGRKAEQPPISCAQCRASLQEYLDGTMAKAESMPVFLHLRGCQACAAEHARWQETFQALAALPPQPVPEDFDRKILASVPYDSYRAMAAIRAPRVPVFLEEESLPAVLRSLPIRLGGLLVAVGAGIAMGWFHGSGSLGWLVAAGLAPEALVRLQGVLRGATLVLRRGRV